MPMTMTVSAAGVDDDEDDDEDAYHRMTDDDNACTAHGKRRQAGDLPAKGDGVA